MSSYATGERRYRPLSDVLRRRQRLRAGLVQFIAVLVALGLGLTLPQVALGPDIEAHVVTQLLIGLAAALLPFMGVVFSLLFLVVQFGSTHWTPRLNLFRDNPIVWRSFAYFTGVIVWSSTAALVSSSRQVVTVLVPVVALLSVLGALTVFRAVQMEAFRSIQLAPTIAAIVGRGRTVIDALYQDKFEDVVDAVPPLPEISGQLRWSGHSGVLRQIDLPMLVREAARIDAIIELTVPVGSIVSEGGVSVLVRGGRESLDGSKVFRALDVGLEGTFDQDPLFAFELLVDMALKAMSPAVNDQSTALHAIDAIDSLLTPIATRRIDIGHIRSDSGDLRVVIPVPRWDDYVGLAFEDIAHASLKSPRVLRRLVKLLDTLTDTCPPARRAVLCSSRSRLSRALEEAERA